MSEEAAKVENTEVQQEQETLSPIEETARKLGHKPKEEFEGDPDSWVPAEEFIKKTPDFIQKEREKNKRLLKEVKDLKSSVKQLSDHYKKVEEISVEKVKNELKKQKIQALEDGNHKAVVEIDEQLSKINKTDDEPKAAPTKQVPQEFVTWKEKNPWFGTNQKMTEYAEFIAGRFAAENENSDIDYDEAFNYITEQVKEVFPQHFRNPNKDRAGIVEGNRGAVAKSKRPSFDSLPEHFKVVGSSLVKSGAMTKEQYIDDLIKIGELKV